MHDAIGQFRDAIKSAGLIPPEVIEPDGKLRRFASNGKLGDDAGWYVLHDDGIPAGSFGDWRNGFSQTWRADIGRKLTHAEYAEHRARVEAIQREREAEDAKCKAEAAAKAAAIWKAAKPATADYPYLTRKGINAHGVRLHNDALVIPMRDGGEIHSLQFIGPDGDKRFLTGGRVAGCYYSIGTTTGAVALCIAEGFATGATIHEATGYPVAVAFNAGNLEAAVRALRAKFPDLALIVCADDDANTAGNPGLTRAREAAQAVGGLVAIPDFGTDRPEGATDFNDLQQAQGLEDAVNDLALVQIPGDAKASAAIASEPGKLRQGEDIVVFGFPLNAVLSSGGNLTPGIVSALTGLGNNTNQIQITAPIQPGSSGSPVLTKKGEVVGVVSMKLSDSKMAKATGQVGQNVNFAVNGQTLRTFLDTHKVDYRSGVGFFSWDKSTADLADEARKWTLVAECWK